MEFLLEIIRLGMADLRRHKLRSVLTSLGIILGVAAVIVVVAIGEGNKRAALRDISALGATNVIVRSTKPPEQQTSSGTRSMVVHYGLTLEDLRRIEHSITDAERIVPLKAVGSELVYGAVRTGAQAFGTTPALAEVARLTVHPPGRYLSDQDLTDRAPVCVIGSEIAKQFFPDRDPCGADIRIDQQLLRVVGVLEPIGLAAGAGSALVGRDLNRDIHLPLTTADRQFGNLVMRRSSGTFTAEELELSEIYVQAPGTSAVTGVAERVTRVIEVGHPGLMDAQVIVPWELLENAKKSLLVWNIMLVAIAAISLLVGGIGIMNIMLASVVERTREIGIRRALGATRRHIVLQFVVETGTLSMMGGLIGIALGIGVAAGLEWVVPLLMKLPALRSSTASAFTLQPQVTLWSVLVSFGVAATVGLVFGIYPAVLASRMDPIEALRHD
ncbi:MAG: ABC transporter permease [Phycisphaerales bacterium]|nr:ABC transporter permease [Phycisphaerales bacterium]